MTRALVNRRSRFLLTTVLALCLTMIGSYSAKAGTQLVPFKATITATLTPPDSAGNFFLTGIGNMQASQLGKIIAYAAIGKLDSATPTDTLTETLTGANGDTITFLCQQSLEDLGGGLVHGTDQSTVIGGTGRFSKAIGSATGNTYINFNTNTVTKTITGSISF